MTIDLSGCSQERKARDQIRARSPAPVWLYKTFTSPLDPSNEGSFWRARCNYPRGKYHDGAVSCARCQAGGLIVPTVVDTIPHRPLRPPFPEKIPAAHHGLLGGAVVFVGVNSEEHASGSSCKASKEGGWGGRPFRRRRVRPSVTILSGATFAMAPIEGLELKEPHPESRRGHCAATQAALGKFSGRPGDRSARTQFRWRGAGNLHRPRRIDCPPLGSLEWPAWRNRGFTCSGSRAKGV